MSELQQKKPSIYDDVKRWLFREQGKAQQNAVISFSDTQTPEELFAKIKSYSMEYWNKPQYQTDRKYVSIDGKAAVAADPLEDDDPDSYIIEPRYNPQQLEILEDCYISDQVITASVNKLAYTTVGPHGKTVLDTKLEFSVEQDRRNQIAAIVKIPKYQNAKIAIDNLFITEEVNFYSNLLDFLVNWIVYGRAAWYVVYDKAAPIMQPTKEKPIDVEPGKYTMTRPWKGLILLDSRRIGRVKVNKESLKVTHIEYLDCETNPKTGEVRPAVGNTNAGTDEDIKAAWLKVGEEVIYWTYANGAVGRQTQWTGASRIEPIVHISQVKRIILNKNTKEAAETHYMGVGRVQFDPNTPDALIINFINSMKASNGKWFGHKIPVTVTVEKMSIDLEKYAALVDLINREILRCIGLPSFLLGYEQIANYANSEQILLAARETDIRPLRSRLKDFLQMKVLGPLFTYYIANPTTPADQEQSITMPEPEIEKPQTAITESEDTKDPEKPKVKTKPVKDEEVKLTYEMEDINFSTKPELAEFISKVNAIVPLPYEAILRVIGMDNWVEEVQANAEKEEQKQKEELEAFKKDPFVAQAATQQRNKFQSYNKAAVAAGPDDNHTDVTDPEVKAAILETERIKQDLYKQIMKNYAAK